MNYVPRTILQLSILDVLAWEPANAYQTYTMLGRDVASLTLPSYQAVHRCMSHLQKHGLIESRYEHGKHNYQLTMAGRACLRRGYGWVAVLERNLRLF